MPSDLVVRVCLNTAETDPYRLVNLIMPYPVFNQMGPQHHIVAWPAALATLANRGFAADSQTLIPSAIERPKDVTALSCSSRGICGAVVLASLAAGMVPVIKVMPDKGPVFMMVVIGASFPEMGSCAKC
jgi:hypothetical protein